MALITRYVNTGSASPGGDGTTNATVGANRAYATLAEWEAAEETNLVTATNQHEVLCTGTTADSTSLEISGWTTSATYYITAKANTGDEAVKTGIDTNRYRITNSGTITINILDGSTRIENLQVINTNDSTAAANINYTTVEASAAGDARVTGCYLQDTTSGGSGIVCSDADIATLQVKNTAIVKSGTIDGFSSEGILIDAIGTGADIYNNVIYGFDDGIEITTASTNSIKNNAVFGSTDDFDLSAGTNTVTNNASDDGDGTSAVTPAAWTTVFDGPTTGDFTLKSTDTDLNGAAIGQSSDAKVPTLDIDGDTRVVGGGDIGIDEFLAAGGANPKGPFGLPLHGPFGGPI